MRKNIAIGPAKRRAKEKNFPAVVVTFPAKSPEEIITPQNLTNPMKMSANVP